MRFNLLYLKKYRKAILMGFDILFFALIDLIFYFNTLFLDHSLSYEPFVFLRNSAILLVFLILSRLLLGVYFNVWRYTNTTSYIKLIAAEAIGCTVALIFTIIFKDHLYTGVWHYAIVGAFDVLLVLTSRLVYRRLYKFFQQSKGQKYHKIPVAIVGAGQIGALLAEELKYSKNPNYKPLFFIDRDPSKVGGRVAGLKVYGEGDDLSALIQRQGVSEIFIALSKLTREKAAELYELYSKTGCKVKLYDASNRYAEGGDGGFKRGRLRDFQIEDLLFRKPLLVNNHESFQYYQGKVVLVTGGGGSIGSEICRQIARCEPKKLIILDIYENNAYEIQQELIRTYGERLNLSVEIASVRDRKRLDTIFKEYRPNVVFHAAAHKHVPLMEHSACEAIKNNVVGTYHTADMAEKYQVEKFILISTDKAVNPTNIMGASKRMCEMIVQCRTNSVTNFAAVRFGNVLGSNGSVIPLFKQQIANGGPITITDKRIVRYFMTIPEASQLVIQAGAMAKKGELFVLDMGKPIRIYDLAQNMIRLSGLEPEVDIKIEEIGLRPGEKLYEELLIKTETLTKTENDMIFIERDTPLSREQVEAKIKSLQDAVRESADQMDQSRVKAALRAAVPTYVDPTVVNQTAANAEEIRAANDNKDKIPMDVPV